MKFNIIGYLIGEGFRNIFKNKKSTISAIIIMCASMIMFGIFFVAGENVNHIMSNIEKDQGMRVFLKDDIPEEKNKEIEENIKKINGVNTVKFISKEEGLEQCKESFGEKAYLLDAYQDDNFLPDSFLVTLSDLELSKQVQQEILQMEDYVEDITASDTTITALINVAKIIRIITGAILIVLIIFSIFIISNTIKLTVHARRKEIFIMKYVGATNSFIRWPFIVEGIIIGIISSMISLVIIGGLYNLAANQLLAMETLKKINVTFVTFGDMFNLILIIYLILGIGIGVIGSSISMRKYLEV